MSGTVRLVLEGPIARRDVPDLCAALVERLDAAGAGPAEALPASAVDGPAVDGPAVDGPAVDGLAVGGPMVVCDVAAVGHPDVVVVDALARLQLTARRHGCRVVLSRPSAGMLALLALAGLTEVVPVASGLEGGGQAEELEEPGVEEVRDPDDTAL